MTHRSPLPVLAVAVQANACMAHQLAENGVVALREVLVDALMVHIRQEAVKPATVHVVGVTRLFRKIVMNMVGDHISLFRYDLDHQIAADLPDQWVSEAVGPVSRIAVEPEGAVAAQNHHAVDEAGKGERPAEEISEEDRQRNREAQRRGPAEEGEPILAGTQKVEPAEELSQDLTLAWNVQLSVSFKSVARRIKDPGQENILLSDNTPSAMTVNCS